VISFTVKAIGPVLLGRRPLPDRAQGVVALLAPALLFALLVASLLGPGWNAVDFTLLAGVAAAVVAKLCRMPMLLAVAVAVVVTALLRAA
jgi:branched-subunit amino acid transport protein